MPTTRSPIRRLGLLGDIHAEHQNLEVALAFFHERVDAIAAVGDIVDGPGNVDRCCELLRSVDATVVRGNHERWLLTGQPLVGPDATRRESLSDETRSFLDSLHATTLIATDAGLVLLCHGLADRDMDGIWPDEPDEIARDKSGFRKLRADGSIRIVLNGHTHQRMVRVLDRITIINAGTLRRDERPNFAIIDFESLIVEFFDIVDGRVTPAETFAFSEAR